MLLKLRITQDGHGAKAYLVNTGWNGTGKRISIQAIRRIIDAILDGSIEKAPTRIMPIFNLEIPTELHDVDSNILCTANIYDSVYEWKEKTNKLVSLFIENFEKYTDTEEGRALVAARPVVEEMDLTMEY